MLSFEKVLRERENIIYVKQQNSFRIQNATGGSRTYTDDSISSISGYLVGKIRAEFNQYSEFSYTPLVGIGTGSDVHNVLSNFEHDQLASIISTNRAQFDPLFDDDTIANYLHNNTLVDTDDLAPYKVVHLAHRIVVKLRESGPLDIASTEVEYEPFATFEEYGAVLFGDKRRSVRAPSAGFGTKQLELLKERFPDGEIGAEGFMVKKRFDIFEALSLPPTPEFAWSDLVKESARKNPASSGIVTQTASSTVVTGNKVDTKFVEAAVQHVVHYADMDITKLTPEQADQAYYGTQQGKAVWLKMSKTGKASLPKEMPTGPMPGHDYIILLTTKMRSMTSLEDEALALLAAGRFVAWKGQWTFEVDGEWRKGKRV